MTESCLCFSIGLFRGNVSLYGLVLEYGLGDIFMSLLNCDVDLLVNGLVLDFMLCWIVFY